MTISAVIFDLDGTVLDNEDEYGSAFRKVLASLGKRVDKKYPHTQGIGVKENWPVLLAKYSIKTKKTIEELTRATQDAYLAQLTFVNYVRGFENFVDKLKDSGIKVALATSNTWWIVDEVSENLNLDEIFSVITTAEEAVFNKPDPEIFVLTADKLGFEPEKCLVIEDSVAGIEAAKRAGMKVIGIARDSKHANDLKEADFVVTDYTQISPQKIAKL